MQKMAKMKHSSKQSRLQSRWGIITWTQPACTAHLRSATASNIIFIHLTLRQELGQAIKNSKVPREQLFVTDKVSSNYENIAEIFEKSLMQLGLEYVDLYLVHEPFFAKGDEAKLQHAWKQMEDLAASGKVKSIGVSNFLRPHLEAILKTASVRPMMNQLEYNPYLQHAELREYMKSKDIKLSGYGPLLPVTKFSGGPLDPVLASLAKKYAVNPGEILLRWVVDQKAVPITTSSKEQRLSDYLRIFTFSLTPKEVEEISETGAKHQRRSFWTKHFDANDFS
jgi:diketogulonate reductase-like aldo/keto reductase